MQSAARVRIPRGIHLAVPTVHRARSGVVIRCQTEWAGRKKQLAAAAMLSAATLQLAIQPTPPAQAAPAALRATSAEHNLSIKRAVLEDLLMEEMGAKLKSLSDDDLIAVLEQIHRGRFPLSLAAPSLHDSSADVNPAASSSNTNSYTSSSEPNADLLMDRQASHSTASSSSATLQEDNRRPKQEQPASVSKTAVGKLPETAQSSQEKAAAASLPDAWQQQSHRLQALTRPLMQRLQGSASPLTGQAGGGADPDTSHSDMQSAASQSYAAQPSTEAQSQQDSPTQAPAPTAKDQSAAQQDGAATSAPRQSILSQDSTISGLLSDRGSSAMDKTGPQSVYGQAEGQSREQVPSNSKGQSVDEPEDATTRMLQSAGVVMPLSATTQDTPVAASGQAARTDSRSDTSVAVYLGAIWRRTLPQLTLLVIAAAISTLAGSAAQYSRARLTHEAVASPQSWQDSLQLKIGGGGTSQISKAWLGSVQGLAGAGQTVWGQLWEALNRRRRGQSDPQEVVSSGQDRADTLQHLASEFTQLDSIAAPDAPQHEQPINGVASGHAPKLDEWGRPFVQLHETSGRINGQDHRHVSEETAGSGTILWVRKDPGEQQDVSGSDAILSADTPASQTILWHRKVTNGQAAEEAAKPPVRLRRSRLHRHEVSVESLLDNVE